MKLKTLISSMAVLGLVSTGAFAAPAKAMHKSSANSDKAFWASIINRNQDNAVGPVMLKAGQSKVTGELKADAYNRSKRGIETTGSNTTGYGTTGSLGAENEKGRTAFSLHSMELYFDSQVNSAVSLHAALAYDNDVSTTPAVTKHMFFPEAYASFMHGNLFATAGTQYLNFGSSQHDAISAPVTESLSQINTMAVKFGAQNISDSGIYIDGALFNGDGYGSNGTKKADNGNNIHGYTAEIGYAVNQGANPFYGSNGFNVYADYLSNLYDINTVVADSNHGQPEKQVAAYAVHGGYRIGAFQVLGDYVAAASSTDTNDYTFNKKAAKPSAYGIEADYSFNPAKPVTLTLGFQGTQEALGFRPMGAVFTLPKTSFLVGGSYKVMKNVALQAEYRSDKDYGTGDTSNAIIGTGTGKSNNTFAARVKVNF